MAKVLTAKAVEAERPTTVRHEVPDAAFPGLYLVVQPGGAKSWAYRYRFGRKPRKMTLGRFPALSLAGARDAAGDAARKLEIGIDPGAAKVEAKAEAREAKLTERDKVKTLIVDFDKRHLSKLKSGGHARQFLDRFVLPAWGERDVQTIAKRDVLDLLDGIVDRGTPTTANRVLAHARKFFNWCVERDILERAPTAGVKPPAREASRDRVLTNDELRWFWKATEAEGQPFGPLARLLLLTGQRLGEGVGMTDRELTGDLWHLSATRTKNGRAHDVPLSESAMRVLAEVKRIKGPRGLIFTTTGETPVSGYDRAIKRLRARVEAVAAEERGAAVEVAPWGFHDLRRTAATGMARLGIPVHVVEALLNHKSGAISGVAAIYNRHSYAAEKRAAAAAWANYVDGLIAGTPSNVVGIQSATK
jgi:integrase